MSQPHHTIHINFYIYYLGHMFTAILRFCFLFHCVSHFTFKCLNEKEILFNPLSHMGHSMRIVIAYLWVCTHTKIALFKTCVYVFLRSGCFSFFCSIWLHCEQMSKNRAIRRQNHWKEKKKITRLSSSI